MPTEQEVQSAVWNGPAGHAWVASQALLDGMLQPFADLLVEAVAAAKPASLLDVGCGAGATTLAAAGLGAACVGADISKPLVAAAKARAAREGVQADFVCADAAAYPFDAAHFDMVISRFGVMFFAEPTAAFVNLRRAAKPGAALRFVSWRSAAENPFMTLAETAAGPLLPDLPTRQPGAPGQFAFADPERVRTILEHAGWKEVTFAPLDIVCAFPARDLEHYMTRLGPVGALLGEVSEAKRAEVLAVLRPAFAPYVHGDQVRFATACWSVGARA